MLFQGKRQLAGPNVAGFGDNLAQINHPVIAHVANGFAADTQIAWRGIQLAVRLPLATFQRCGDSKRLHG